MKFQGEVNVPASREAVFDKINDPIFFASCIEGVRDLPNGQLTMEVALQYNDSYSETVFSFANNINTVDGGSHLSGFRSALTRTINAAGQAAGARPVHLQAAGEALFGRLTPTGRAP